LKALKVARLGMESFARTATARTKVVRPTAMEMIGQPVA
jgi:hypothetical protein